MIDTLFFKDKIFAFVLSFTLLAIFICAFNRWWPQDKDIRNLYLYDFFIEMTGASNKKVTIQFNKDSCSCNPQLLKSRLDSIVNKGQKPYLYRDSIINFAGKKWKCTGENTWNKYVNDEYEKISSKFLTRGILDIVVMFSCLLFLIIGYQTLKMTAGNGQKGDYGPLYIALAFGFWAIQPYLGELHLYNLGNRDISENLTYTISGANNLALILYIGQIDIARHFPRSKTKWINLKTVLSILTFIYLISFIATWKLEEKTYKWVNIANVDMIVSVLTFLALGFMVIYSFYKRKNYLYAGLSLFFFPIVMSFQIKYWLSQNDNTIIDYIFNFISTWGFASVMYLVALVHLFAFLDNVLSNYRRTVHQTFNHLRELKILIREDNSQTAKDLKDSTLTKVDHLSILYGMLMKQNADIAINPSAYFNNLVEMATRAFSASKLELSTMINVELLGETYQTGKLQNIGWVILELLNNAVKHSPQEKNIAIYIMANPKDIHIYVENNVNKDKNGISSTGMGEGILESLIIDLSGKKNVTTLGGKYRIDVVIPI